MYFWLKDCKENIVLKDPEYYRDQSFQEIIYRINEPFLRDSIQSAFTNFTIFDKYYFRALFGADQFPDGSYIIDYEDEFMEYQKAFMRVLSEIRSENMMTYPVLSYSLLKKKNPKHALDMFADEEFARWCSDHNCLWTDSNFFADDNVNSLSNCCRLKSDINNPYFNSIGGTALSVGSVKVNTLNLARIAYECPTTEEYFVELKKRAIINLKALHCVRHIIKRNVDKGLLPNYKLGNIDIKNQYNTLGICSLFEAIQHYGFVTEDEFGNRSYTDEGIEFAKKIMEVLKATNKEFGADKDYMINIEQIPGEKAAHVLMEKDRMFHPNEIYELPLYANQWIPLGVKTTIAEKIRISAILDEACSGGSITHINIEAPFADKEEAWKALNYIVSKGVTYFAFTSKICTCKNNHGFFGTTCPKCGNPVNTKWRRIVGFYVPEITYSAPRKAEAGLRTDFDPDEWADVLAGYDLQ